MVGIAPLLITFILASGVSYTVYKNNQIDFKINVEEVKDSNMKILAESSIELVKASMSNGDFETNQVFYIKNQDLGYKYLQNKSLNKVIKDFDFDNGTISVGYKIDSDFISAIIQSNKNNKEIFMIVKFSISILNNLPIAYSGAGGMTGGSLCSVQYNGTNSYTNNDVVNPNFNIFMDGGFKVSGTSFEIPTGATNDKKIAIHSNNGSGSISGYKEIDEYYNMNNVSISNGAYVGKIEVGGAASIDKWSSVGELIQNSNYQYPSFNTAFKDNDITNTSKNQDGSSKDSVTCGTNACMELNQNKCTIPSNPYSYWSNYYEYSYWNWGYTNATTATTCLETYGTKSLTAVNNPYTYNPEKGAWNWGYSNSTEDCSIYGEVDYTDLTKADNYWLDYNNKEIVFDWSNPWHRERRYIGVTPHYGSDDEGRIWINKFVNPSLQCSSYLSSESNLSAVVQYSISDSDVYKNNGKIKDSTDHLNRLGYIWGVENPNGSCQAKYYSYMTNTKNGSKYGYLEDEKYWSWDSSKFVQACEEGQTNYSWCDNADSFYQNNYIDSGSISEQPKNSSETSCEIGQSDYKNRSEIYTDTYYSNKCQEGYVAKKTYDSCQTTIDSSCIDSTNVSLPAGNYDKLIIGNNCNLDLTGSEYTFTEVIVKNNGDINFTNDNVQLSANTIEIKNNTNINYEGVNDNSYMIISSNNMSLGNNSGMYCLDPKKCLIDTNNYDGSNNSTIMGNLLARDTLNIDKGEVYGNLIAETMNVGNSKVCNILDSNNNQMMSSGYYNISSPNTSNTIIQGKILQAMCSSIEDCYNKLNN